MSTAIDSEKRHGQHYTPTALAHFLATRALDHVDLSQPEITIIDPACGDGELLIVAASVLATEGYRGAIILKGFDIDDVAIGRAHQRFAELGLAVELIHGDFLSHQRDLLPGSVDLIITNPPYVRTQHIGAEASQLLAQEYKLKGRVDLTHPFVTVAPRLLKSGGVLGLLCSNRFLTTLAGENVRSVLLRGSLTIRELYDLGDTKLFQAAVLPAIIIASKHVENVAPARYVSAYESPVTHGVKEPLFKSLTEDFSSLAVHNSKTYEVRVGTFIAPPDTKTPWRLSDPGSDKWLADIERSTWKTFGDVAKIRVGVKSTADKVFLHTDWDVHAPEVESDILLPLITQTNITPWRISEDAGMKVLYPYDLNSRKRKLLDMSAFPGAMSYFNKHEARLRGRTYVTEGGREWFELWVPQQPALWAVPKIVFPDISEFPRFALDTTGAVVNGNCYWISLEDIGDIDLAYLMIAVANSSLGTRFYDETCGNKLYSGKRRWMTQYVKRMPLPNPYTKESQALIQYAKTLSVLESIADGDLEQLNVLVLEAFRESDVPSVNSKQPTLF